MPRTHRGLVVLSCRACAFVDHVIRGSACAHAFHACNLHDLNDDAMQILCMHGGLSPELKTLEQIKRLCRPADVPDTGLLCDLLWADPEKEIQGWGENDRGVSYTFGADAVTEFLQKHDLDLICRAHQVRTRSARPVAGRTPRVKTSKVVLHDAWRLEKMLRELALWRQACNASCRSVPNIGQFVGNTNLFALAIGSITDSLLQLISTIHRIL